MGHKGPVLRPKYIGPARTRTHILFYSIASSTAVTNTPNIPCNYSCVDRHWASLLYLSWKPINVQKDVKPKVLLGSYLCSVYLDWVLGGKGRLNCKTGVSLVLFLYCHNQRGTCTACCFVTLLTKAARGWASLCAQNWNISHTRQCNCAKLLQKIIADRQIVVRGSLCYIWRCGALRLSSCFPCLFGFVCGILIFVISFVFFFLVLCRFLNHLND